MPIPFTKYRCKFKCGTKSNEKINRMQGHENVCWNNPDNKTCKTCSNEVYIKDSESIFRGCKLVELDLAFEQLQDILRGQNAAHVRPIFNCPYHNKEADGKEETFKDELIKEINESEPSIGTTHFPFFIEAKKTTEYF